ncbi:DUF1801 domain-containing protein [Saxibacter everestensis]|uniref:DUF1801 domain-containing protein n=1 Tax=Saxibacter everestensis TaxID=2909229 RepID=A0ABY8QSI9_9MICO|nr:DUF1801 domain-containing protein [Brevibacteriaceae bacterium ZFBP1038]
MDRTPGDVPVFLAGVTPKKRQTDAEQLIALMSTVTGEAPQLWGTVIGFGQYHYKYKSGREGDAPAAGFSPRKAATTIYLPDGVGPYSSQLQQLGPHTTGVGCVYIKDLQTIDLGLLEAIITESYRAMTSGTNALRARDGAPRG